LIAVHLLPVLRRITLTFGVLVCSAQDALEKLHRANQALSKKQSLYSYRPSTSDYCYLFTYLNSIYAFPLPACLSFDVKKLGKYCKCCIGCDKMPWKI